MQKFRNKVLVVDYYRGPILYKSDRDNSRAILKGTSLKKNIHQLLNRKPIFKALEFNYVLERYYEQVECLYYITNWMNNNLTQLPTLDNITKGLFQIQYNHYKSHFETLVRHFFPKKDDLPKGNFDVVKIIESSFPEISKRDKKKETQLSNLVNSVQKGEFFEKPLMRSNKKETINKVKKQPLITEKEAEDILLERIFNVDLKAKK